MKCFVIMGFGEKMDFSATPPRTLDLNRTFEDIIEPTVSAAGLECIRADKIIHSSVIDKVMYELLLEADLVIADLSTSNANAIYELGVRHALRPHATIVMAEDKFKFPFDLNHVSILHYRHLGPEIGYQEVMRVRQLLSAKIAAITGRPNTDSPVFLFLPQLLDESTEPRPAPADSVAPTDPDAKSVGELLETFRQAKQDVKTPDDWLLVVAVLNRLRRLQANDSYVIQQLALATYKSERPDKLQALRNAESVLSALTPETSVDAETVGLWGAIHKRLFDTASNPADLDRAIRAYARGYFIKNDHYNGINFAFLLDRRASREVGDDALADRVLARRIRQEVLTLCDDVIRSGSLNGDDIFWVKATKVEALVGLGRPAEADQLRSVMVAAKPAGWMVGTMDNQIRSLRGLLGQ